MATEVVVALISGGVVLISGALGFVGKLILKRIDRMHDDNRNDHGMVRSAIDGLTSAVGDTNAEVRDVKADVRTIKSDVRDLRDRVTDLEEEVA
jgi:predicted  nucleic acid-binding Zn-ribbon protein